MINKGLCEETLRYNNSIYLEHVSETQIGEIQKYDYNLIVCIGRGTGIIIADGNRHELSEGDIFVIEPGISFSVCLDDERYLEVYYCCFYKSFIENELEELIKDVEERRTFKGDIPELGIMYVHEKEPYLKKYMIKMIREYMQNKPGSQIAIRAYLILFLTEFLRKTEYSQTEPVKGLTENMMVDQTIRNIHHSIYSSPSPKELARHRGVSLEHLCREFKKYTGMTMTEYINDFRIYKVKDILKNTDRPIEGIADLFGCRIVYLQRQFKKLTGMTMSEYRKKYHYK